MNKLIAALLVALSVSSRAATVSCLVFDAAAPLTLSDNSVVYPLLIPRVTQACAPAADAIVISVSPTCHPIEVKSVESQTLPDKIAARIAAGIVALSKKYTVAGLYADTKGNCGPIVKSQAVNVSKQGQWSNY